MSASVLISEHLSDEATTWLAARAKVQHVHHDEPGFEAALADASALVVRTYTIVNEHLLDMAPHLQVVGRAGVGLDNIDLAACEARGIKVCSTPDANTQAVVEYVLSLLLHDARPTAPLPRPLEPADWRHARDATMASRQLSELQLGILGCGRIGSRVAQVARAIGIETRCCDLLDLDLDHLHGARQVPLTELLVWADVLSVHVDGRPANRHLLGTDALASMKHDALLLNTSRGFVIDPDALACVLQDRPAMRAVLDVHDPEPITRACPLWQCDNAVLLPHAASRTQAAQAAMSWVVRDVAEALGLPVDA